MLALHELVVFHDADGCLNPPDGQSLALAENDFTDVEKARLRQFGRFLDDSPVSRLILNTGRSWEATRFLCQAIDSEKLQYVVVEHGAEVWDLTTDSPLDFDSVLTSSNTVELTQALASKSQLAELIDWFEREGALELAAIMGYSETITHASDKSWNLTFNVPESLDGDTVLEELRRLIEEVPDFQNSEFVFHYSRWNRFLDVMGRMDKGLGMAAVSELLGIENNQTAAIGDGLNDLSMLERAAIPVCPANSEPRVIQLCGSRGYVSNGQFIDGTFDWIGQL